MRALVASTVAALLAGSACGSDGRDLRAPTADLPAPTTTAPSAPSAPLPVGSVAAPTVAAPTAAAEPVTIDELFSPANAIAEVRGRGAGEGDPVTVDGRLTDVASFVVADDGSFVLRVSIADEGAHTVCVADACGRVYTLAPDAETREEIVAKIEAAIPLAQELLDWPTVFPGWTVEVGGALAGTGGTTDVATKTVTVYRNRGRTVDDFVRTVLHELGHVADHERLDDDARRAYLSIRGFDPETPWSEPGSHVLDEWGRQPSEDFAEVMVMVWSQGRWTPRTTTVAEPRLDDLAAVLDLLDPPLP